MMEHFFPAITALLLVACADTQSFVPTQKAQKVRVSAACLLDMESLCKNEAVQRCNTGMQRIGISGLEQLQDSYEMHDPTFRKESFVCSLDADGQFLYLSMC